MARDKHALLSSKNEDQIVAEMRILFETEGDVDFIEDDSERR